MKKELIISLIGLALISGAAAQAPGGDGTQESNVTVNVAGVTTLDVRPSDLTYDSVSPGERRNTSQDGYEHIELSNIGSNSIGEIYAQASMPTGQPFGDSANSHNTGNLVTINLDTAQSYGIGGLAGISTPHYVNRVEYFESNPPQYLDYEENGDTFDDGSQTWSVDTVDVGRFRVGAAEYFFASYTGTGSQRAFTVGRTPHTPTELGTTDISSGGEVVIYSNTSGSEDFVSQTGDTYRADSLQLVSFNASQEANYNGTDPLIDSSGSAQNTVDLEGAETRTYNVFVDQDDEFVLRTKFNVEQDDPQENYQMNNLDSTGAQQYILDAPDESGALQPGQNFPANFGIQVPLGIDQDEIVDGTVEIIASDELS